jgi:hypothetical protein
VEELVAARPGQLDGAALRRDCDPVEAFGHALECRT